MSATTLAELRQLATQIVMLRHGRIAAFGGVKVLPGRAVARLIPAGGPYIPTGTAPAIL